MAKFLISALLQIFPSYSSLIMSASSSVSVYSPCAPIIVRNPTNSFLSLSSEAKIFCRLGESEFQRASSSYKSSRAFMQSFTGLFSSSQSNLSSFTSLWYGRSGKSRGEKYSVSTSSHRLLPSVTVAARLPFADEYPNRYFASWFTMLWPQTKCMSSRLRKSTSSLEDASWNIAPLWLIAPMSCILWSFSPISVSMNAYLVLSHCHESRLLLSVALSLA